MTHVTYRLTGKNQDQLQNPALGNRVLATFSSMCFFFAAENVREKSIGGGIGHVLMRSGGRERVIGGTMNASESVFVLVATASEIVRTGAEIGVATESALTSAGSAKIDITQRGYSLVTLEL